MTEACECEQSDVAAVECKSSRSCRCLKRGCRKNPSQRHPLGCAGGPAHLRRTLFARWRRIPGWMRRRAGHRGPRIRVPSRVVSLGEDARSTQDLATSFPPDSNFTGACRSIVAECGCEASPAYRRAAACGTLQTSIKVGGCIIHEQFLGSNASNFNPREQVRDLVGQAARQ
jgi:hypothetical protein